MSRTSPYICSKGCWAAMRKLTSGSARMLIQIQKSDFTRERKHEDTFEKYGLELNWESDTNSDSDESDSTCDKKKLENTFEKYGLDLSDSNSEICSDSE